MRRAIAERAALARLRRRLEAQGLAVWKATKREIARLGLAPGDHVVTSREGIVETGSLDRLCRRHGALETFEAIDRDSAVPQRRPGGRRRGEAPASEPDAGQGRLPL